MFDFMPQRLWQPEQCLRWESHEDWGLSLMETNALTEVVDESPTVVPVFMHILATRCVVPKHRMDQEMCDRLSAIVHMGIYVALVDSVKGIPDPAKCIDIWATTLAVFACGITAGQYDRDIFGTADDIREDAARIDQ